MKAILLLLVLAMTACAGPVERALTKVQPPVVVTKIVEKAIDPPAWATVPLPNEPPRDGTVEALKDANNRRADTIDRANCERRLLLKASRGEQVTGKECKR